MDGERGEPHPRHAVRPAQQSYLDAAASCSGRVGPLLAALEGAGGAADELAPFPGEGRTAERFAFLQRVATEDVTAARVLEPHLDALAILHEAGVEPPRPGSTFGVFAAEAPGAVLRAAPAAGAAGDADAWVLDGVKPWCSLGARLTDALVTATTEGGDRRMFLVSLRQPGVTAEDTAWVARGLAEVQSGPLRFDGATARPVGGPGWYLDRPGFRWGAVGVAAAWWGGCLPFADALIAKAKRAGANQLAASRAGRVYRKLDAARAHLASAAAVIDSQEPSNDDAAAIAHAVRGTVADAVVETLAAVRDVLGPAALAFDESLARRYADLDLYVSQYHRGPDDVSLAAHLPDGGPRW
ncbi:acyl-CoA/acyl-ACP dehydrogenase [Leifsonia sp. PS1209]|nr:acyl-CoA/acyl-ACP dehydrogenase [Leifsonia sp. PS1209]